MLILSIPSLSLHICAYFFSGRWLLCFPWKRVDIHINVGMVCLRIRLRSLEGKWNLGDVPKIEYNWSWRSIERYVDLFIVASGDESRECFLFRSIAAAESELRGDITGKRRNPVDLVPGIRKYWGFCIAFAARTDCVESFRSAMMKILESVRDKGWRIRNSYSILPNCQWVNRLCASGDD